MAPLNSHKTGMHQGITRVIVIRESPRWETVSPLYWPLFNFSFCVKLRPWHVFVDISPHEDVDFEVAATFDKEPNQADINVSIVECLEGSKREDQIVAEQMQAALNGRDRIRYIIDDEDMDDDFLNEDSC